MPLALWVAALDAGAEVAEYDLVAVPVHRTDAGIAPLGSVADAVSSLGVVAELDEASASRHRFEAKSGQTHILSRAPGAPTVLLIGVGESATTEQWRQVGAAAVRAATAGCALLFVEPEAAAVEAATIGGLLASYRYDLRSKEEPQGLERLDLVAGGADGFETGRSIAAAVALARDFINRAPSELTPTRLAEDAFRALEGLEGVEVEVWDEDRIEVERLGGLLGVARGSHEAPRLVKATYTPSGGSSAHVVLVGKGITFDSGGLSLKTAQGMTSMKTDMTGAAVVLAAITALAALEVAVTVTAIAPMAENMPSGTAMKPGDVLTPRCGTTIEVLNTDAEGRLILADGLTLAVEESPDLIVDVATLTGAAVAALGREVGAMLTNDEDAAAAFMAASAASGEKLWRLPLVEEYESHIASEVADIKNVGVAGEAGTISAALFLQRFVDKRPWVHLDIAGPGRSEKESGLHSKGGSAFSLRTLLEYLRTVR